jgi:hypothetical protein
VPADIDPEHGESALLIEIGHALDKARNLFGRGIESWRRITHLNWSLLLAD